MSKILKVIQSRRSLRKFDTRPVEREKLELCIEAARLAPSADNIQPWRFIILDDPEIKDAFAKTVFTGLFRATRWALKAPVLMVYLADIHLIAHRIGGGLQKLPYYLVDIGIAGEHFALQAQEMGLGTCWIGWFDLKKAEKFLRIPAGVKVCELMAVGYPQEGWSRRPKKLKPWKNMVFYNQWGNKKKS